MQFCIKHVMQAYNSKTALTRITGSPWERVMLSQGPAMQVVDLLLSICATDGNLAALNQLGGHRALHNLSRYADSVEVRQQATVLLTKIALSRTKI